MAPPNPDAPGPGAAPRPVRFKPRPLTDAEKRNGPERRQATRRRSRRAPRWRIGWQNTTRTHTAAVGYATPITYAVDDRQYVVITAGGGERHAGNAYVTFTPP